ncbi:MAG: 6-phosphogluconate dehydrogenase (decarboxylating), partial [Firmicutes bacterium]|nr:6-phosphogluconate dehydrogenase (decarboxylating) [Bacillota bacterium]
MQLGMVGLGRMGLNMLARLVEHGHAVVGFDPDGAARQRAVEVGGGAVESLPALVETLTPPRAIWVMVPAGEPTETVLFTLADHLASGDAVVDGGNSYFRDTVVRAKRLAERGIQLVDAGTSGGIWGRSQGYCLMVGGDPAVVRRLHPLFAALAPEAGFLHVGPVGAGHFVKMVHNG